MTCCISTSQPALLLFFFFFYGSPNLKLSPSLPTWPASNVSVKDKNLTRPHPSNKVVRWRGKKNETLAATIRSMSDTALAPALQVALGLISDFCQLYTRVTFEKPDFFFKCWSLICQTNRTTLRQTHWPLLGQLDRWVSYYITIYDVCPYTYS